MTIHLRPSYLAAVLALVLVCTGCNIAELPPLRTVPGVIEPQAGYADVRLLFSTDRNSTGGSIPTELFGNQRSSRLTFGTASVSIPATHKPGHLESGLCESQLDQHVVLHSVMEHQDRELLLSAVRKQLALAPRPEIFLYVHGYANTFEDAARRTAQIVYDTGFTGVPMFYSWPSRGWLLSYLVDSVTAEWSSGNLASLLDDLLRESGASKIHVMAHSMGAQVVTRGINTLITGRAIRRSELAPMVGDQPEETPRTRFGQIILAASDMDTQVFERDYLPILVRVSERVTIYISRSDEALISSNYLHMYGRLGSGFVDGARSGFLAGTDSQLLIDRVMVVDASNLEWSPFGHFYYGDSPTMLSDLGAVLDGGGPEKRDLLRHIYYELRPDR